MVCADGASVVNGPKTFVVSGHAPSRLLPHPLCTRPRLPEPGQLCSLPYQRVKTVPCRLKTTRGPQITRAPGCGDGGIGGGRAKLRLECGCPFLWHFLEIFATGKTKPCKWMTSL